MTYPLALVKHQQALSYISKHARVTRPSQVNISDAKHYSNDLKLILHQEQIMPLCAAFGCNNRTGGTKNEPPDVSFHAFPHRNPELMKKWLHNLSRKGYQPSFAAKLCSRHFTDACYKVNLYEKYVGLSPGKKSRRILRDDAVNTEFVHRQSNAISQQSSDRSVRVRKRQVGTGILLFDIYNLIKSDIPTISRCLNITILIACFYDIVH